MLHGIKPSSNSASLLLGPLESFAKWFKFWMLFLLNIVSWNIVRMKISIGYFLHDTRLWSLTVTQTKMLLTAIWRVSNTVMTISATAISLRLLHSVFSAATVRFTTVVTPLMCITINILCPDSFPHWRTIIIDKPESKSQFQVPP